MRKLIGLVASLLVLSGVAAAGALAAAPQNTTQPSIEGTFMVGKTVTANNGSWSGSPTSFTYQWQRCDQDGSSCGKISGQTSKTYKLTDADVGNTVRLTVTGKNSDGSTSADSKPSDVISGNAAPRVLSKPTISGKAQVGETLTADPGKWAEGPSSFTYQWQSCDKNGDNCKDSSGATGKTYGVRAADKDNTLRVEVTAKNLVDSTKARSETTDVVTGGTPTPTPTPVGVGGAISITAVSLPNRLVISQAKFTPNVIRSRDEPLTARFRVTETQAGKAVAGALVYAVGVPANRVTNAVETQTDSSGWATITFRPLRGLPMRQGAQLVLFVRARKGGENVLAGVSNRRLFSVRVHPTK
jgi:hypothetical protein